MSTEGSEDARAAVVAAARRLREAGCDGQTVARLFVNGAALLLSERLSEEAFVELCRASWRAGERQAELVASIDRALAQAAPGTRSKKRRRGKVAEPPRAGDHQGEVP